MHARLHTTPGQHSTHLGIEPVGHCRALEPVQVLRVEDGASFGLAHEMQQPKVHLMHARAKNTQPRAVSLSPISMQNRSSTRSNFPHSMPIYPTSRDTTSAVTKGYSTIQAGAYKNKTVLGPKHAAERGLDTPGVCEGRPTFRQNKAAQRIAQRDV